MTPANLPGGRAGQALAAGLALFVALAVWIGLVAPVFDFYGARAERVATARERLARESALVAALPKLQMQAALASRKPARAVLPGASDAIAGAALQEQVQSMASATDAQLTSIETLPAEQMGAYRRIGVHVELSAQLPVILNLMRAIEDAQPSMLIDDIRLTATPVAPQNPQLPLDAAFTVYGFRTGARGDSS